MIRKPNSVVALILMAWSSAAWSDDTDWPRVQSAPYHEMPDAQFVQIFDSVESPCRQALSAREEHIAEVRKLHSERMAKEVHDSQHFMCKSVLNSRMNLGRVYGYHMHADEALDPAFWQHLDQARENLK